MTDWDDDTPRLREYLARLFTRVRDDAIARRPLSSEVARARQRDVMGGLPPPDAPMVGRFRGEPGLETFEVRVGSLPGVPARSVRHALRAFDRSLEGRVRRLDASIARGDDPTAGHLGAILELCVWAHAEWVRIHPFANGNGRTARLWANSIAMRYGLPPFVRIRPPPCGECARAAEAAMTGDHRPTVALFIRLYRDAIGA